jgi:hypothetical protein
MIVSLFPFTKVKIKIKRKNNNVEQTSSEVNQPVKLFDVHSKNSEWDRDGVQSDHAS